MSIETTRARVGRAMAALMGSPWAKVVGKAVFVLVAMGVLAAIGRVGSAKADASAEATADAGASRPADASGSATPAAAPPPSASATPPSATTPDSAARGPTANASASSRASPEAPVALNLADETELRRLPGVGPKRAQSILTLRAKVGRFQRLEDLMRVKGVGRATLKKWRPLVTLESAPRERDGGAP